MFGSPMFLWALCAAAIPLMLHMFQRRRTVRTPFPTIRFLKAAQKRSSSRVRFENFLLWLLRTALLVALALAFAQPVLRNASDKGAWLGRSARDVAIVIDGSFSMGYETERGKVWDTCKDAAEQIVRNLNTGDRVCVYLAADSAVPVIEKPTSELPTVVQAIQALECRSSGAKLEDAVALAMQSLARQGGKRQQELFIFTDGQAISWQGFRAQSEAIAQEQKDAVSVFALLAGAANPDNTFLLDAKLSPQLLLAGQSCRIRAKAGHSGSAKESSLSLAVDGEERSSRSLSFENDGELSAEFVLDGLEPGVHVATLSSPKDALAFDDEFRFLIRVGKQLPVLVAGPEKSTRYLRAALAPGADASSVKTCSPDELADIDLRDFQAIFLCDAFPLSGQSVLRVENYVKAGGVAVVFPGENAVASSYSSMNVLPAKPVSEESVATADALRVLKRIPNKPDQEVTFSMPLPPGTVPSIACKRLVSFGELDEKAAVLVTAGEDIPFLIGRSCGRGRVFFFAVGATREWSTFPLTAFFVPMVHQLIRQGAGASIQPPYLVAGMSLPANEAIPLFRPDDDIIQPSGAPLSVRDDGAGNWVLEKLEEEGIYIRRKADGTEEPVLAVNADRSESNLTMANPAELTEWTGFKKFFHSAAAEELLRSVDDHRNGRSFTEVVLWLALLLAVAEWWFANSSLKPRKGATEKLKISMAGKVSDA